MTTQTRARELLAAEYRAEGMVDAAHYTEKDRGIPYSHHTGPALRAIEKALFETALRSERAEVAAVLGPFAEAADYYDALTFGAFDGQIIDISANINVGQLRAARDLLRRMEEEK